MKYIVCLVLCLAFAVTAFAEDETVFSVVLTSGKELTWQSLFLDGDSICTYKSGGTFCVSKTDVASYKEIKRSASSGSSGYSESSSSSSGDGQGKREGEAYSGGYLGRARSVEKLLGK